MKDKEKLFGQSVALSRSDMDIVEAVEGKNFSHKMRHVIRVFQKFGGVVARVVTDKTGAITTEPVIPGAVLVYHSDPSQHYWENKDALPVAVKQKQGHVAAAELIKGAGWLAQIIDIPEEGIVELWAAPAPASGEGKDCAECRRRVLEALSCPE